MSKHTKHAARPVRNRKAAAVLVGSLLTVTAGGGAFAYWSAMGDGTGTATSSAGTSNLAITQTSTVSDMRPGDSAQTLSGSITNNATSSAYVSQVVASIASVDQATGAIGTCDDSDYSRASPTMTVDADIAAGDTVTFTGATLQFNNKATNQDGCKGATVNLSYDAS